MSSRSYPRKSSQGGPFPSLLRFNLIFFSSHSTLELYHPPGKTLKWHVFSERDKDGTPRTTGHFPSHHWSVECLSILYAETSVPSSNQIKSSQMSNTGSGEVFPTKRSWFLRLMNGQRYSTLTAKLDFAKAFDSIPHYQLLRKANFYGIQGQLHHWLKNFLTTLRQRVVVNGSNSNWSEAKSDLHLLHLHPKNATPYALHWRKINWCLLTDCVTLIQK